MPPLMIGDIDIFVLIQHHPDMEPDDRFHLFQGGLGAGLYGLEIGHEGIGYSEADRLQDLGFGLDVVIKAGRLYTHVFGKIAHGCGAKAFFSEEPGGFFDDHLFFGAVPFGLDLSHSVYRPLETAVAYKYNNY